MDRESSTGNIFTATTLDSEFTNSSFNIELQKEDTVSVFTSLSNQGALTTTNTGEILTGISDFDPSALIDLVIKKDGGVVYDAPVSSSAINYLFDQTSGQSNNFTYEFFVSETDYNANIGKSMEITIKNNSWANTSSPGVGFTDTEDVIIQLNIPIPLTTSTSSTGSPFLDMLGELGNTNNLSGL